MDWSVLMMFALMEGALAATPGPAVLLVISQGLRHGSAGALRSSIGILAANALYFAVSGTGVGALLAASGSVFSVVKWAGAGYLLYLGAVALLRPPVLPGEDGTREDAPAAGSGRRAFFLRGFVLQLSNPKALVFFVAVLPQFIDTGRPVLLQTLILGATSIAIELAVLAAYGAAASGAAQVVMRPRFASGTSRVSGVLLVGAALGLLRLG